MERIVAPIDAAWDSFFNGGLMPTDDFLAELASQEQVAREPLDSPMPERKPQRRESWVASAP